MIQNSTVLRKTCLIIFICVLTESIVQAMMTYWSDTQIQIPVQIICVDSFHSDGSVSNLLGDLYHSVPHLNVIFIARLAVVSSITKEVKYLVFVKYI